MDLIVRVFAQGLVQLLAATGVAFFSLYLVSKQTQAIRPYKYRKLSQDLDDFLVHFQWTPRDFLRLVVKLLVTWWKLKRGSMLGWTDMGLSLGVFSLAVPGLRDIIYQLLLDCLADRDQSLLRCLINRMFS